MPIESKKVYKLGEATDLTTKFEEVVGNVAYKSVAMGLTHFVPDGICGDVLLVNMPFLKKFLTGTYITATENYNGYSWTISNERIQACGCDTDKAQALIQFVEDLPRCLSREQNLHYCTDIEALKELLLIASAKDFKELFNLVRIL